MIPVPDPRRRRARSSARDVPADEDTVADLDDTVDGPARETVAIPPV